MATAIKMFRNEVIPHVPGCPFISIDQEVVKAVIRFCEETHILNKAFEAESFDYTTIDSSDNDSITVTLSDYFTGYIPLYVMRLQIDGGDVRAEKYEMLNDNSNLTSIQRGDTIFFSFPTSTTMKMFPFTDRSSNFDLFIDLAVKPASTITGVDDFLYEDWREGIAARAISELQRLPNKPWSDRVASRDNMMDYQDNMGRAKIRVNNRYAKGSQIIGGAYF